MQEALIGGIFAATIVALYLRPRGVRDWQVALVGASVAWIAGPLSFADGIILLRHSWNIVAFFLGLMLLAAGAEAAGLYERVASVLRHQRPGRRRVVAVLVLGTAVTAILSNDATPLVLTPAVFAAGGLGTPETMRAALAVTFAADGASLLLPISNPVNLLFYERFSFGFGSYALHVLPAAAAGIAVLAVLTWIASGKSDAGADPGPGEPAAGEGVLVPAAFTTFATGAVAVLALAYIAAAMAGVPLGLVTLGGGATLFIGAVSFGGFNQRRYREHISAGLLVFVASLLLLVAVVSRVGLLSPLVQAFGQLNSAPVLITIAGAALIATLLSNLVNNWPAALLLAATIAVTPAPHGALVVGSLIGCTIGANLTMVGSLSTVFWLSLLRQRGAAISPAAYFRASALPTLAAVAAACLVAAVTL